MSSPTDTTMTALRAQRRFIRLKQFRLLVVLLLAAAFQIAAFADPAVPPYKLVVLNGAMTQGTTVPAHWDGKFGDVEAARDTEVYKSAPASLRVSVSGGKSGQAFQTFTGGANATVKIAGWFKTAGSVKAQVLIQAFADGYKQNQFNQILYLQGDQDWTHFEKEVTLPGYTAFFNIGVLAEGDGKAWLDDVHEASSPVDQGQILTEAQQWTSGPPDNDKPNVPGWGFYPQSPQAWLNFHHSFLDRTKQGNVSILFLGDSITQGWTGGGKEIWEKRYAPLGAADYGIGGDSTRQVLWRLGHGEVDSLSPKLIVLMIGTNNLYGDFNAGSDEEIAAGITKIVTTLQAKLPTTRILLCGLLPRQNKYFSGRIAHINKLIAPLDDGNAVRFLDMGGKFQTALGKVKHELYNNDQLHPVAAGYVVWADTMQPLFDAMLHAAPLKSHLLPLLNKERAGVRSPGGEYWQPVAMERPDLLAAGIQPGGEGCQYPQTIAVDSVNGSFILYGTDVGGIFRSVDGGRTFLSANLGYSACGSSAFAIDPKNPNRCLAVGDNAGNAYYQYDGIYLSTDRGASWTQALPKANRPNEKAREQIAYDPGSFDPKRGYCTVAYWAEEGNDAEAEGRIYKTTDGGESWTQIADGPAYSGGKRTTLLKVAPVGGTVYLANDSGFYKSTDGGATFTRKADGNFTSLDVIATRPRAVYITTGDTLSVSNDGGETFTAIPHTGIDGFYRVKVSPADPQRMLCQNPKTNARCFSNDGGKTWVKSAGNFQKSWFPPEILYDDRARLVAWSPLNPKIAWGIGPGDIITQTTDGGATFQWANNGNNGMMTGGLINFNTQNPNVLYVGSQDYNGGLTVNGGKTWQFINLSKDNKTASKPDEGDPWGWVYGGYAASPLILYGGNRATNESNYNLWITFDGGKTTMEKVKNLSGAQVSYGVWNDPNVLFCWNQRSADRGQTWKTMIGCDGVFTSNPRDDHELYGRNGKQIVTSLNNGETWTVVTTLPAEIRDIGFDQLRYFIYAATEGNHLYLCDNSLDHYPRPVTEITDRLPRDQHSDGCAVSTVAVDPVDPNVVYAGANGTGLFFQKNNGVSRSLDGGETWERLTENPAYCRNGVTGGQMASAIRVDPLTRELFVGTDCYGCWKIAPPGGVTTKNTASK